MSLGYGSLFIPVLLLMGLFIFLLIKREIKISKWIKLYWDKQESLSKKISDALFLIGVSILLICILDLRGSEQKISYSSSEEKTILLIDASASMLVEDVRPNRFKKAIFMARHFVKKANGQQISIIVFSDKTKRLIPFTTDKDLLDARLKSLENMNLTSGGTALVSSISESVQYLRDKKGRADGNLLIFTDAENTTSMNINRVPLSIRVGLIGIGTEKGGFIPIRNHKGSFLHYLTYKGKKITSKMSTANLKDLGKGIKHFKFWKAGSYSLDTQAILSYFSQTKKISDQEKEKIIRPVIGNKVALLGILFLLISYLLRWKPAFVCLLLFTINFSIMAQEAEKPKKNKKTLYLEQKLMEGSSKKIDRLKLAEEYLRIKEIEKSTQLYKENLNEISKTNNKESQLNWAISMAQQGRIEQAYNKMMALKERESSKESSDENFINEIKKNLIAMTRTPVPKPKNKSSGDKKDQQQKKQGDNQDQKNGEGNPENGKNQEKSNSQGGKKKEEEQKKNEEGKMSEQEKRIEKRKARAMLGQLKDKDRELQSKYIDKETRDRKYKRDKKQW